MSIETWQPDSDNSQANQKELIAQTQALVSNLADKLIGLSVDQLEQDLDELISNLNENELDLCQAIMTSRLDKTAWQTITKTTTDNTDLLHPLIFFFTLLESKQSRFFAGEKSPVIPLNKLSKHLGHKLDKHSLLWIRSNTENKFLPNGPITL